MHISFFRENKNFYFYRKISKKNNIKKERKKAKVKINHYERERKKDKKNKYLNNHLKAFLKSVEVIFYNTNTHDFTKLCD